MKRLLLVVYDFPPRGGTGVLRVTKFVRYLPEFGWEPVVVTVDGAGPHPDPQLLVELPPDLEVLRVRAPGTRRTSSLGAPTARGARPAAGWRAKIKPWLVPDPQIAWVPQAIMAAQRRLWRGDISVVMTSGPPFSTHLIGWWLKQRRPILPWLMDLRDLWSEDIGQYTPARYKLNLMLERQCCRAANHVIAVTDGMRDIIMRHLQLDPAHISTITNGFDPNDFVLPLSRRRSNDQDTAETLVSPLMMRYIGTIAESQAEPVRGLFMALLQLQHEGIDRSQIWVQLIGSFGESIHAWAAPLIDAGIVEFVAFVTHENALALMIDADVLLFIRTDDRVGRIAHGNKLFEYLALGRPILAISPPGEATRLLASEQAGLSTTPQDVPAIVQALRHFLAAKATGNLAARRPDPERLRRFQRRELAGQLAHLLDTLHAHGAVDSQIRQ